MKEKKPEAVPVGAASEVMNNPPRARARVVGLRSPTEILEESFCSPTTGARVRTRTRVKDPAAYFRAWRIARWGGDFDPVRAAVEEAVESFSTKNPESDRAIWLKIANRVGAEAFMEAVWQKQSEIRNDRTRLRDTASAFQKLLNARFPKPEGGAR